MFSLTSIKTKVQLFLNSKAANVYNKSEKTYITMTFSISMAPNYCLNITFNFTVFVNTVFPRKSTRGKRVGTLFREGH